MHHIILQTQHKICLHFYALQAILNAFRNKYYKTATGVTYMRYMSPQRNVCHSSEWHIRYLRWYIWVIYGFSIQYIHYPMLRADSRFWLVNNREIWSRISRLTSSAWDIQTKERHWWRHNGDSDHRPLSLPLRYDRVTLCLYGDLGQINGIAGILKLRKRFKMWQILFEHGMNSLLLVCFRGHGNLSTLIIAIPRLAFGRAWYCDAACWLIPVSASANKG